MPFKDHFTRSAVEYSRYRPRYPEALFQFFSSSCPGREAAWDCATGSGQAAVGVAPYFERVIATDASERQIRNAETAVNVTYMASLAEESPLANSSMDLAMVAQAVHWFSLERFYSEVRRIVKPGGIIAAWVYSLLRIDPDVDRVVNMLYSDILGSYWPPERKLIDDRLVSLYFPFNEIDAPAFQMEAFWNLDHLTGYLGTWSAVNRYKDVSGSDPLSLVFPELSRAWGDAAGLKRVAWPIHMKIGRR
ncbi:MAG: class I SAM-dependent methyltransferase [Syntrophobacter sp.]